MRRFIIFTLPKYCFWNPTTRYVWSLACNGNEVVNTFYSRNPNRKTPFQKPRNTRVHYIKTDLQETGWKAWIGLIWLTTGRWGRLLQAWWTSGFDTWNLSIRQGTISFSRWSLLQAVNQPVSWLPIIRYLVSFPCNTIHIFFLCTHKHKTLTILSSITQNISSSLCITILELSLPEDPDYSVSATNGLTRSSHRSRLLISVFTHPYSSCSWKKTYWSHTCD
jgi:hypothetical protein